MKTIVHIPNVNSRESTKDKIKEVEHIMGEMGEWQGTDPATGFQLVKIPSGKVLRIADLVDDDPAKRDRVVNALKDPAQKFNRDHVDIIIALGMAKEGFDWIWCEHALTVGYRSSLTEIVQIIGRVTRDAEGKTRARFTNLIAEPDATRRGCFRSRQRHAEGDCRQLAHGTSSCTTLGVPSEESREPSPLPAMNMAKMVMTRTNAMWA